MIDRFDVSGKTVLLTGAADGIGLALAKGFWAAGAVVLAVTRRPETSWPAPLPPSATEIWRPLVRDLAEPGASQSLFGQALAAAGGRIDVLINNAAICPAAPGDPYDEELRSRVWAVDLETPYALCGLIAPHMAALGGGSIINVTTINAERAWPGNPAYITAKAALRLLTKAVALDFGEKGVRANNLCPGYINTKMNAISYADPVKKEIRRSRTMLGRWGEPDDLVGPAIFLASEASRYVTGLDLHVDGGWLAKGL